MSVNDQKHIVCRKIFYTLEGEGIIDLSSMFRRFFSDLLVEIGRKRSIRLDANCRSISRTIVFDYVFVHERNAKFVVRLK